MSKRLGGNIGCKDKVSSWHLIDFPNGSNIGSTVSCRGETQRYTVHTCTLTGPLFPIGIKHLIYMKCFCYGSSYGY